MARQFNRERFVRNIRLHIAALAMLARAFSAHAGGFDADGIDVSCRAGSTPCMADVARAIKDGHFWATKTARHEMLMYAREACASGSTAVTFVPPPAERESTAAESGVTLSRTPDVFSSDRGKSPASR
jgi:hypothetical protein